MIRKINNNFPKIIGWGFLGVSFLIGIATLYRGAFGDEADNLVVGSLLLQNYALYRDIFSHHFPFPYYWMAIVVKIFGNSIFAARFSVLIFQLSTFVLGTILTKDYLMVGTAALIWSIVRSFYRGNLVLYYSFSGPALFLILLATFKLLQRPKAPGWNYWLIIGLFSVVSIMSDPLSVYAVTVTLIFIFSSKPSWGLKTILLISICLAVYFVYLNLTGTFQDFWNNAIEFNLKIYGKYSNTNPFRIGTMASQIVKGLEITDKVWFDLDPFKSISDKWTVLDRWLFSGFLYRFSIIGATLFLASRKMFREAIYLYLFAAAVLLIDRWDFRAQPFIMISVFAISFLATKEWWFAVSNYIIKVLELVVRSSILILTVWLCIRLVHNLYANIYNYREASFSLFQDDIDYINELTCNQQGVTLAYYPGGTYYYWFTELNPVSKYIFMWPWVVEVGLDEVIDDLDTENTLSIVVISDVVIWSRYDSKEYLLPLTEYLEASYIKVRDGTYISLELFNRCHRE